MIGPDGFPHSPDSPNGFQAALDSAILDQAKAQGMEAVIPPKKNRSVQRLYDKDLYKARHLIENAFLHLKTPLSFSPPSVSDALPFGQVSHAYII
jgi:hypothetical protein